MPSEDQNRRLANILGWVRTAKATLPAIDNRTVAAASVAQASALLDRMYRRATALRDLTVTETATQSSTTGTNAQPGRRAA